MRIEQYVHGRRMARFEVSKMKSYSTGAAMPFDAVFFIPETASILCLEVRWFMFLGMGAVV